MKLESLNLSKFESFEVSNTNTIKGGQHLMGSSIGDQTYTDINYDNGHTDQGSGWDALYPPTWRKNEA